MEQIKYGISATFFKRNVAVKSDITIVNGQTVRKPSTSKPKAEGYRISAIDYINPDDISDFRFGQEVTEFSVAFEKDENGNILDLIPVQADYPGARTFHAPFNTTEAAAFIQAYGEVNGSSREIYNARAVSRSNCGAADVVYVAAIGEPIQKTLLSPELREKITDDSGALKPEFREKFGKKSKKASNKNNAVAAVIANQL